MEQRYSTCPASAAALLKSHTGVYGVTDVIPESWVWKHLCYVKLFLQHLVRVSFCHWIVKGQRVVFAETTLTGTFTRLVTSLLNLAQDSGLRAAAATLNLSVSVCERHKNWCFFFLVSCVCTQFWRTIWCLSHTPCETRTKSAATADENKRRSRWDCAHEI